MTDGEFATDLRRRVLEAREALAHAQTDGDHYGADVRAGELVGLQRLAEDHGIALPELGGTI